MTTSLDEQLLLLLEDFKPRQEEPVRSARRPAGQRMLVESWTSPGGTESFVSLLDFWTRALYRFLEDTGSDVRWFEGLAYQALFQELTPQRFFEEYRELQHRLTLLPPETVGLLQAFRVLDGRVISYMGLTAEGDFWAGTFGPCYFGE